MKLPCWACFFLFTLFFVPAGGERIVASALLDQQEIELAFYMGRNGTPALFIAVDGLKGHSQEFGELFLCFAEFFP